MDVNPPPFSIQGCGNSPGVRDLNQLILINNIRNSTNALCMRAISWLFNYTRFFFIFDSFSLLYLVNEFIH